MEGQSHTYEIVINQGDLLIELSSDDVYFISKQMDKWFKVLLDDSYVPVSIPKAPVQSPAPAPTQAEPTPQAQPVAPADMSQVHLPHETPPAASIEQPVENPAPQTPEPQAQPMAPPPPPPVETPVENPASEVVQKSLIGPEPAPVTPEPVAEPPPAAVESVPEPQPEPVPLPQAEEVPVEAPPTPPTEEAVSKAPQEPAEAAVAPEATDDFEKVMDTLMEDLGEGDAAPVGQSTNGAAETDDAMINSLADLCKKGAANTAEDFMLLSAYYLTYFEAIEQFSLKKLNSMMVKSGLTPVNHSVLETALSKGFLNMVPDMTGTADVTEYSLTDEGQQYASSIL